MLTKRIDLYAHYGIKRPENALGYLNTYVYDQSPEYCEGRLRPAMLMLPGGGYAFLSDREKEPVAVAYLQKGYNAFTLEYSISPVKYPAPLLEGCMAMAYIREHADEFHIDRNHVAAVGFSAGGHLCGMLATLFGEKIVCDALGEHAKAARPDAVILSYPVISSGNCGHASSFDNLCGDDKALREALSLENRVTADSVPAFIWCTVDDNQVPSENSLVMAAAYKKAGVPFELHMFRSAPHGVSLATTETLWAKSDEWVTRACANPHVAKWMEASAEFLAELGFAVIY